MSNVILDQTKPEESEPKRRHKKASNKQVAKILDMAAKEIPVRDIALAVRTPKSTVQEVITRFAPVFKNITRVSDFRTVKADILSSAQLAALESAFSGKKLEKAGFLSTLQGFEILNKAERLENNQSTENHAHRVFGSLDLVSQQTEPLQVVDITQESSEKSED